jgi:hypothetical protein
MIFSGPAYPAEALNGTTREGFVQAGDRHPLFGIML